MSKKLHELVEPKESTEIESDEDMSDAFGEMLNKAINRCAVTGGETKLVLADPKRMICVHVYEVEDREAFAREMQGEIDDNAAEFTKAYTKKKVLEV